MRRDTQRPIKVFRAIYREHPSKEDIGDYLDQSIIPNVQLINRNPSLATTGSCSGHDGGPFIGLVFRDRATRIAYLRLLRYIIPAVKIYKSDSGRMSWFTQVPKWRVTEEWAAGLNTLMPSKALALGSFDHTLRRRIDQAGHHAKWHENGA